MADARAGRAGEPSRPARPAPSRRWTICFTAIAKNEARKKEQAAKGLDSFTYFMVSKFTEDGIPNPERVAGKVREAFERHPNWKTSEAELREARKQVTFAIFSEEEDLNKVTAIVDALFTLLQRSYKA
jgi:type I restriction enzyme R subunit